MKQSPLNINRKTEFFIIVFIVAVFIFCFKDLLLNFSRMLSHDSIWFYGIFQYFAQNIQHGIFPFWDPYDYCGQPFYPDLSLIYVLNPIVLLLIFLSKIFSIELFKLYHWMFFLKLLFFNFGLYLLVKDSTKYKETPFFVLVISLFCSITFSSLRQIGILHSVMFCPWAILFFMRYITDKNIKNSIFFAFFTGLSLTGYQGIVLVITIMILTLSLFLNRFDEIISFFKSRKKIISVFLFFCIIICFSLQLLSIYIEKNKYFPLAREKTTTQKDVDFINGKGGISSTVWDFAGLIYYKTAGKEYFQKTKNLSEGFLHIGVLALFIAIFGLIKGKDKWRTNMFVLMILIMFIMLGGSSGIVLRILGKVFPFISMLRHTFIFSGIFIVCLLYFVGLGLDSIMDLARGTSRKKQIFGALFIICCVELFFYSQTTFGYVTMDTPKQEITGFSYNINANDLKRQEKLVTTGYIRYYKPILHKTRTSFDPATIPSYLNDDMSMNIYQLHENAKDTENFIFYQESSQNTINSFINWGIGNFDNFSNEQKEVFFDILYLVEFYLFANQDFYFQFKDVPKMLPAYRALILIEKENLKNRKTDEQNIEKIKQLTNVLTDLQILVHSSFNKAQIEKIEQEPIFNKELVMHNMLLNKVSVNVFIDYIYNRWHRDEFTILQMKQYRELLEIYDDKNTTDSQRKILKGFMGIDRDLVQFYTKAVHVKKGNAIKAFLEEPKSGLLYIEDSLSGQTQYSTDPEGFRYDIITYNSNYISMNIYAPNEGWLYLSDSYDDQWLSRIDGVKTKVFKSNICFKAIKINEGEHVVEFIYSPTVYKIALWVYYICFTACFVYICFSFRLDRGFKEKVKR
ncbi:MAG: YfhO family protein [Candidatus Omnitrophica bacterium]|nr:YfhO family protein [Candidatus Omnitrophota bacterium]